MEGIEKNTELDVDGQPLNGNFNRVRNRNKAAATLYGVLNGITADQQLNDTEILFLQVWLEQQSEMKGDILDIYDAVKAALEDGVITSEEREDLKCLLDDCLEFSENVFESDVEVNQFVGFLKGISADGIINKAEFERLKQYVFNAPLKIQKAFPFNIVYDRINMILRDQVVDDAELKELNALVSDIVGTHFTEDGDAVGGATSLFNDAISGSLNGKNVCFTGKFISGSRKQIESKAASLGAIPQGSVTNSTDYVVIGTMVSRDWIHESSGRKIEKAMGLKKKGAPIIITNEQTWNEFISE
ncbi:MAG: BRCT domain-containing protein [Fibrobacter sp.]|nr:BRCT domain-containing protein [Fibrobacter sp.]